MRYAFDTVFKKNTTTHSFSPLYNVLFNNILYKKTSMIEATQLNSTKCIKGKWNKEGKYLEIIGFYE